MRRTSWRAPGWAPEQPLLLLLLLLHWPQPSPRPAETVARSQTRVNTVTKVRYNQARHPGPGLCYPLPLACMHLVWLGALLMQAQCVLALHALAQAHQTHRHMV